MAGLLSWAADVVAGGGGGANHNDERTTSIPLIFTPDQQNYVRELNQKAASLSRSVRDLRLRLPPPDISQRLPHLHAHSLASTADLTLQLNAHSSTREQVSLLHSKYYFASIRLTISDFHSCLLLFSTTLTAIRVCQLFTIDAALLNICYCSVSRSLQNSLISVEFILSSILTK